MPGFLSHSRQAWSVDVKTFLNFLHQVDCMLDTTKLGWSEFIVNLSVLMQWDSVDYKQSKREMSLQNTIYKFPSLGLNARES